MYLYKYMFMYMYMFVLSGRAHRDLLEKLLYRRQALVSQRHSWHKALDSPSLMISWPKFTYIYIYIYITFLLEFL